MEDEVFEKMSEENNCSFGEILNQACNQLNNTRTTTLRTLTDFSDEKAILIWRSNLHDSKDDISTICNRHFEQFGRVFERNQVKCIGLDTPKSHKAKGQKTISLIEATKLKEKGYLVVPGQKLCRQCIKQYQEIISRANVEPEKMDTETETEGESQNETEDEHVEYEESPRKRLNSSFESVGVSPVNLHSLPPHSRVNRAKEKLKTVMSKFEESISTVYNFPMEELKDSEPSNNDKRETIDKKADEFDKLCTAIKEKLLISSYPEKVQLLNLHLCLIVSSESIVRNTLMFLNI